MSFSRANIGDCDDVLAYSSNNKTVDTAVHSQKHSQSPCDAPVHFVWSHHEHAHNPMCVDGLIFSTKDKPSVLMVCHMRPHSYPAPHRFVAVDLVVMYHDTDTLPDVTHT